jgi:hypothetical protein
MAGSVTNIDPGAEIGQVRFVTDVLGSSQAGRAEIEQGITLEHHPLVILEIKAKTLILVEDEGRSREKVLVTEVIRMEMGEDHAVDVRRR